jgi:hypothetical protein
MFNLPLGTSAYPFSIPDTVMVEGKVVPSAFLCRLADIAKRIQEADELYTSERAKSEHFEKVLKIDQELEELVKLTPAVWWNEDSDFPVYHILQFWHQYLIVRTHLQLALKNDESNYYAYSQIRCIESCQNMAQRYSKVRRSLPVTFFAGNLFDLQALTPAIFLLYIRYRPSTTSISYPQSENIHSSLSLVHQIINTLDFVSQQSDGDFALQVSTAIRSVITILDNANDSITPTLTLVVPLLGKIHVKRQTTGSKLPIQQSRVQPNSNQQGRADQSINLQSSHDSGQIHTSMTMDSEIPPPIDWIMEVSDDFLFMADEEMVDGNNTSYQWLSLKGFDSKENEF